MGLGDWLGGVFGSHTDEVKPLVQSQNIQSQNIGLDQGTLQQQQSFAQALQQQMNGQGPSLAGTMLKNQAQQNAAGAMGMAAAQRGVNPGLAMRQGLQAGNQGNQMAAQQAAQARIGEQMGAQGMLGNQLNTMQTQNMGAQEANQRSNLAAQQANQQAALGAAQLNTGVAVGNTQTNNQVGSGVVGGLAGMFGIGSSKMAHGGYVRKMSDGGQVGFLSIPFQDGAKDPWAHMLAGNMPSPPSKKSPSPTTNTASSMGDGVGMNTEVMAGGPMDAMGGAGAADSGMMADAAVLASSHGGHVPGKAQVPGDSPKNDTVPTMLSPEEIVIPRTVALADGFVPALIKHLKTMKGAGPKGFAQVLAARKGSK